MKESFPKDFWNYNLNPITGYKNSGATNTKYKSETKEEPLRIPKPRKTANKNTTAITIIDKKGNVTNCESVVKAASTIGVSRSMVYGIVNGYQLNKTEYQIFKSKL